MKKEFDFICYYAAPREKDYLVDLSVKQRREKQGILKQYLAPVLIQCAVNALLELSKGLEEVYEIAGCSPERVANQVWQLGVNSDSLNTIWPLVFDVLEWPDRRVIAFILCVSGPELDLFLAQWYAPGRLRNPRVPLGRMLNIITKRMDAGHCAIVFDRVSMSQFMLIKPV